MTRAQMIAETERHSSNDTASQRDRQISDRRCNESAQSRRQPIETIDREELKEKLNRGDEFELVMTIGEFQFERKHIPGSRHIQSTEEGLDVLDTDDEIVVYCAHEDCTASRRAYEILTRHGYTNVRRYAGGITDWEDAGYPVAGKNGTHTD